MKKFKNLALTFCLFFFWQINIILAQEDKITNPLITNFQHELLPKIDRNLTILENKRIKAKIQELDNLASEELLADNIDQAFSFWYQAINLSRFLNFETEIKMIIRVSEIAWNEKRRQDIIFLQERLLVLEEENSDDNGIKQEVLPLFIAAYESLHYLDKSIILNLQSLSLARDDSDEILIKESLERLGKLYLAKFDYYQAEPIYQELLDSARLNQDYLSESIYLQELAQISQALVSPTNSVQYKEDLAKNYQQNNNLLSLSRLKISIGDDYKALDNPQSASESYREAFSLALSLEQYAMAGDALKQLGKLYQQYEQLDSALQIYQELIKIESGSYNFYGLMNTYDFIGTIYTQKEDYLQALNYFEKASAIARELKYKEDYFIQKIDQLKTLDSNE